MVALLREPQGLAGDDKQAWRGLLSGARMVDGSMDQ